MDREVVETRHWLQNPNKLEFKEILKGTWFREKAELVLLPS